MALDLSIAQTGSPTGCITGNPTFTPIGHRFRHLLAVLGLWLFVPLLALAQTFTQSSLPDYIPGLPPTPLLSYGLRPIGVVFGDFDQDGINDMVVLSQYGYDGATINDPNVVFYKGDHLGNMTVTNAFNDLEIGGYFGGSTPHSILWSQRIVAADLNRDGKLDLVISTSDPDQPGPLILYGLGNGDFSRPAVATATPGGRVKMRQLHVHDMNHDGWPDIVAVNDYGNVVVYTSLLGTLFTYQEYDAVYPGPETAIADVDHDGNPDVVFIDPTNNTGGLVVMKGRSDGSFLPASYAVPVIQFPHGFDGVGDFNSGTLVDLDGDGNLDYLYGSDTQLWWFKGAPDQLLKRERSPKPTKSACFEDRIFHPFRSVSRL